MAKRKRGRPPTGRAVKKNVTIDPESLAQLQDVQRSMASDLGFMPTLTQTVKRLIAFYTLPKS